MWSTTPIGKLHCSFNANQQCIGISLNEQPVSQHTTELVETSEVNTRPLSHHTLSQNHYCNSATERKLQQQLQEYFQGSRTEFDIPIFYSGTAFQMQVWKQIQAIPYGTCISYRHIAIAIGSPYSYRAVGHAVGLNPLPIIVPCHRVVRSDGTIGEYALHSIGTRGRVIKRFLLHLESQQQHTT